MKKRTLFIIIGLIVIITLVIQVTRYVLTSTADLFTSALNDKQLDSATYTNQAPKEYLDLFKDAKEIVSEVTDKSKRRNDISHFRYKQQFYLMVYKINSIKHVSLNKILKENFNSSTLPLETNYKYDDNDSHLKISFKEGARESVTSLLIMLFGSQTKVLKRNDSIAYYHSNLENFSLRYNNDSAEDIYGTVKDKFQGEKIPFELILLKRNGNLYFLLMYSKGTQTPLQTGLLYNLIK